MTFMQLIVVLQKKNNCAIFERLIHKSKDRHFKQCFNAFQFQIFHLITSVHTVNYDYYQSDCYNLSQSLC